MNWYEIEEGSFTNLDYVTRITIGANEALAEVCFADSKPPIIVKGIDEVKELKKRAGISK